jgi:hypothetical protein
MTKRILLSLSLLLTFAFAALAADVNGKWTSTVPGRDGGTREVVYNFKADGDKLSGTMSGFGGQELALQDGKISGDTLNWVVKMEFGGNSMEMKYSAKVAGDEMKITREGGRGPQESTAKRVK